MTHLLIQKSPAATEPSSFARPWRNMSSIVVVYAVAAFVGPVGFVAVQNFRALTDHIPATPAAVEQNTTPVVPTADRPAPPTNLFPSGTLLSSATSGQNTQSANVPVSAEDAAARLVAQLQANDGDKYIMLAPDSRRGLPIDSILTGTQNGDPRFATANIGKIQDPDKGWAFVSANNSLDTPYFNMLQQRESLVQIKVEDLSKLQTLLTANSAAKTGGEISINLGDPEIARRVRQALQPQTK